MTIPLLARHAGLPLLVLLCACGDLTSLDLSLDVDPNINSEPALVQSLARLELVVDSPEGLYPGSFTHQGDLEVRDLDGDGKAEARGVMVLGDLGRLPRIRLEQGGLSTVSIELRLDGRDRDSVSTAAGGVQGLRFVEGETVPVKVPFNLRAKFRPPRVIEVYPEDGSTLGPLGVRSVGVGFSKAMDPTSLTSVTFKVLRVEGDGETLVPAEGIKVTERYPGGPTWAEYRFVKVQETGSFRVRVTQGARDTSGRALDQVFLEPGNQPFKSTFKLMGRASTPACAPNCQVNWCGNGGEVCGGGLACDKATGECRPTSCPESCGEHLVCDPLLGACVDDCRIHGSYGGCAAGSCGAEGLCR